MKRAFTTEWLNSWQPAKTETLSDRDCRGLFVRGGARGGKAFYRFTGDTAHRVRIKLGFFPKMTLEDARAAVNAERERDSEPGVLTVDALSQSYKKDVLEVNRESAAWTWGIIRTHILPVLGTRAVRDIEASEVASVVRAARERREVEGRRRGGQVVARVVLRELKSIFAHGVETGVLKTTPAGTLRARAFGLTARKRSRYLEADEVRALFDALDLNALLDGSAEPCRLTATTRLALAFQLYVPLRSQSLIGARWSEVNFEARTWTVPPERLKERGERAFVVPLPETALVIMRRLHEEAGASPWVLASPRDHEHHVEPKALIHALVSLQRRGHFVDAPITVHDLRRTWRAWALDLGVDHVVAERSLGHVAPLRAAGFSGAADTYARGQMVEQRRAAAEQVAAAFDRVRVNASLLPRPLVYSHGITDASDVRAALGDGSDATAVAGHPHISARAV